MKKSLRLVNRDPERFAPVLFDFLRFVLEECGIRTSPEELLAKIFNAGALSSQLDEIIEGVKDSSAFEALPNELQVMTMNVLVIARDNLPSMLGIVERRLLSWRRKQRNSSAMTSDSGQPAIRIKPNGQATDNTEKADSPSNATHNQIDTQKTRKYPIEGINNAILSVAGDYYCYEKLGWGSGWETHDLGGVGQWTGAKPGAQVAGKLSRGGSPKDHQKLFKLTDPSFGTGIDAIWCANGCAHNDGKPFAIIDAKASVSGKKPKYMSKPGNNTRKPGISSLLEGSGSGRNRVVQMSHEWIDRNIDRAVPRDVARKIRSKSPDGARAYSRHILYTPHYSDSLLTHLGATFENGTAEIHDEHAALHYSASDVKAAVSRAKLRERKTGKYPGADGLKEEKMNTEKSCRQPFATKAYFQRAISILEEWNADIFGYFLNPNISDQDKSIDATRLCTNSYDLISIAYTDGQSPEQIIPRLDDLVAAYEKEHKLSIISYGSDEVSTRLGPNDDYEQFLQTLSLCILLGRGELIPRLSSIFDRDNKGQDAIYETLLSFYDDSRVKTDELLFKRPFAGLLKVIRAATPKEASTLLDKYCKAWYPAFKKAPWHDSHLSIDGEDGSYSGYWAFEAGAIAYLFNIDDSQIDHMVYPKDLVAYARSNTPKHNTPGPIQAGQPCPHTGY